MDAPGYASDLCFNDVLVVITNLKMFINIFKLSQQIKYTDQLQ